MKTNRFLIAAAVVLISVAVYYSCSKDKEPAYAPEAVMFTSEINRAVPNARASDDSWDANDKIGIFMIDQTTNAVEGAVNKQYYTSDGTKAFTPVAGNEVYYPVNGSKVNFIAYYPYDPLITTLNTYSVDVLGHVDLLWAKTTKDYDKTSTEKVALTFDHMLARLVLNCKAGADIDEADVAGMTVVIKGMNTNNQLNLKTGTFGAATNPQNIIPSKLTSAPAGYNSAFDAIILPAAAIVNIGDFYVEFTIKPTTDPEVFTWKMPSGTKFDAGNEYTYNVTLTRSGLSIEGTINKWVADANNRHDVDAE